MGIAYILGGKVYDFLDEHFEKQRYAKVRKSILPSLRGNILDAGCGTGRNFPYYSKSTKILAIDKSEAMLKSARQRAENLENNNHIKIKNMDITKLNLPDNSRDAVVATFVLCVIPKKLEESALNELIRVAKPGAKIYALEYVYSKNFLRRFIMKLTSFIPKLLYGIRFNSTFQLMEKNKSLSIERLEFVYDDVLRLIVAKKKLRGGDNK